MKIKNSLFYRHIKILVFVLALSFSSQSNASTTNSNFTVSGSSISYQNAASINIHALTWGNINWGKVIDWFKNAICNKCGSRHGGSCGGGTTPPGGGGGTSIPLDGGLSILALGAAAFGIRKLRGNKKDKH